MRGRQPVWFLSVQGPPTPHSVSTAQTHLPRATGETCQFLAVQSQVAWVTWANRSVGTWVPQVPTSQGCPCSCQRWEVGVALAVLGPAGKGWQDGYSLRPQSGPCRQLSPPGATFSHTSRGLWLAPGRLQEQGPDPEMLRTSSTAELSNCPLSAPTRVNRSLCPSKVPDLPQPPGPNTLQQGFTSLPTAPPPPTQTVLILPEGY